MSLRLFLSAALFLLAVGTAGAEPLPAGFVYLKDVDPTIRQDMRYYGSYNFIGRPIDGYFAPECILTTAAARALREVNAEAKAAGLVVEVFDCYRPQRAVADFVRWSRDSADQTMKPSFYPVVDKADFFALGYVAEKSGHSRGGTVDLTLVPRDAPPTAPFIPGQTPLVDCRAPWSERLADHALDFGTGFDCMDPASHHSSTAVPLIARHNRSLLAELMAAHGFKPLVEEWWHFTLIGEPFPDTYFDFPITAPRAPAR